MKIIKATWWENDIVRHQEYFSTIAVASKHVKDWKVTDWGSVDYQEIKVTDK